MREKARIEAVEAIMSGRLTVAHSSLTRFGRAVEELGVESHQSLLAAGRRQALDKP